jgi:O-antigen/teichoic acid export membrane protein
MKASEFRTSLFNAGCRSTQTILLNVISVPAMAYIIRKLGATGYGQWSTAVALVTTVGVLTNLGLRGVFVRAVARDPAAACEAMARQLGTRLILAVLAGAAVIAAAWLLRYPPVVIQCTLLAAVGLIFTTVFTTASDLFEAFQRFPAMSVASLVGGLALTAASVLAVGFGGGPVVLSVAYLIGPLLTAAVLLGMLRRECFRLAIDLSPRRTAELLWGGRHFAVQQLLTAANANIVLLLLPKFIGMERFGLFAAGVLLVTRLAIFPDALGTAFYPMIATLLDRDPRAARRNTLRGVLVALGLCSAVAITATLSSAPIAQILFPKSPAVCRQVIVVTIWALPLMGVESMIGYALNAAGCEAAQARLSLYSAAVSLALATVLVLSAGIAGACWFILIRPVMQIGFNLKTFVTAFSRQSSAEVPGERAANESASSTSAAGLPLATAAAAEL